MKTLRKAVLFLLHAIVWVSGMATIGGLLANRGWLPDLAAAFRPLYLALQAPALLVLGLKKRWVGAAAAFAFLAVNAHQIAPLYQRRSAEPRKPSARLSGTAIPRERAAPQPGLAPEPAARLRVLQLNVGFRTKSVDRIAAYLAASDADVVALEEVSTSSWRRLERLLASRYPYRFAFPLDTAAGIALLSRIPFAEPTIEYLADPGLPSIVTEIHLPRNYRDTEVGPEEEAGREIPDRIAHPTVGVGLLITHPLSPTTRYGWRLRNEQLRAVARYRMKLPGRAIVVGDLNVTSWSPVFEELLEEAGLLDTRKGFGIQPTWPALGVANLALVPIDHVLVSPHFEVASRKVGPYVGSDHLPVTVDLEVWD